MNNTMEWAIKMIVERNGTSALNKKQTAKELNISVSKIDELRKSGELKFKMVGGQVRISAFTIAEMIA